MNQNQLPEIFESFADARKTGFLAAKEFKDQGNILIGTYCTYMPQELPLAMGAGIVSLCATSDETILEAEKHLPRNLCPLIKSSYGFAITDKCPYFYYSDMIVGETTCDGKKKMYEHMAKVKPTHVMMLPNSPEGERSLNLWKNEIHQLRKLFEEKFDKTITDEDLKSLPEAANKEIEVVQFVPSDQVDPIMFERSYYLEPEGKSPKSYLLLRQTLEDTDRTAIVTFALRQKTRLGALRIRGKVLVLHGLLVERLHRPLGRQVADAPHRPILDRQLGRSRRVSRHNHACQAPAVAGWALPLC